MEFHKNKTCCFTGHREEKLPWGADESARGCIALKERISAAVEAAYISGITHFICGMATGCDMYFCEAVLELRGSREEITLEAAIPYQAQSEGWPEPLRRRYDLLVSQCDYITVVSEVYTPECMMRRNRYMVDSSSLLIAAYNGSQGGTMNTLLYAMRQGVEIIELSAE